MQIHRRGFVAAGASALLLPGCVAGAGRAPARPRSISFETLVRQIKHDIGSYIVQHQDDVEIKASEKPCAGQVNFAISKVKLTVTTTIDQSSSGNVGLKVPLDLLTISPSGSGSRGLSNSVTTSLAIFPITAGPDAVVEDAAIAAQVLKQAPTAPAEFMGTPICDALNQLRADLIRTADVPPCFNFGEGDQRENSVKWAFTVTEKRQAGGKLELLLFSIGSEASQTRSFANVVETSFIATGEGFG
ncbi:MAG: hypothetical protein ACOY45_07860 [Pseudomonadota bacterium]